MTAVKARRATVDRDLDEVTAIVKKILSKDFRDVVVEEVRVFEDLDTDGDEILRVYVVFDGKPSDLDAGKLSSMVRRVRPELEKIKEEAFPLFSFVSKKEWKGAKLAMA